MSEAQENTSGQSVPRDSLDVDIVCVGFGPATGGFLTTLNRAMSEQVDESGMPLLQSQVMPGMPPQVMCYERGDDLGFGVSGVVTRARAIRESFPDLDPAQIPMAHAVTEERVLYLLDPIGASRRTKTVKAYEAVLKAFRWALKYRDHAVQLPFIPGFMKKHDGVVMSMGQFNSWVASELMAGGQVQIWPGMPVAEPLIEDRQVAGVRLVDQGVARDGSPDAGYMPGMDIRAKLTVVGDGPVGQVGRKLDEHFGMPDDHHQRDWAVGMKMVVDLRPDHGLEPGTVFHTLGYPEPEIFGFLYVYPDNVASLGIFVPSWFDNPARTSYRYLQHWMRHPYIWRYLEGGTLRSWGAKTIGESGRRGEPHLAGNGYARIGEGSGSTNVLTNSGVDEAWMTGRLLAEGVVDLLKEGKAFTRENLEEAYVRRRRESWLDTESQQGENARDGFQKGILRGLIGMGLSGITGGRINWAAKPKRPMDRIPTLEEYYKGRISPEEIAEIRTAAQREQVPLHDKLMEKAGWPKIEYDGQLIVSHQDALLMGGKVQAMPGYEDHVAFLFPHLCETCGTKLCFEICSAEAIYPGENGMPQFDREKCIHCGACQWNCTVSLSDESDLGNLRFNAGSGGLHSAEN